MLKSSAAPGLPVAGGCASSQQHLRVKNTSVFPTRVVIGAQNRSSLVAKVLGGSFEPFVSQPQQQKCRWCHPSSNELGLKQGKFPGRAEAGDGDFHRLFVSRTAHWISEGDSLTCVLLSGNGLASVSLPWTWPGCGGCHPAHWAASMSGSWRTM